MYYNILHRLAQIRDRGIQARIFQQYVTSKGPKEQPSTIDVSMVTVAPILVTLVAGYVIGRFVLMIERCVRGNILKCWPRGSVRKLRQIEYWRLLSIQLTAARTEIFLTYSSMIPFNSTFSSLSISIKWSVFFGLCKTLFHSALKPTVHTVCETHLLYLGRKKKRNRQLKTEASIKW